MTCKNCGMRIVPSSAGPKPWISVTPKGSYGSFVCSAGQKVFVNGHEPGNINA